MIFLLLSTSCLAQIDSQKLERLSRTIARQARMHKEYQDSFLHRQDSIYTVAVRPVPVSPLVRQEDKGSANRLPVAGAVLIVVAGGLLFFYQRKKRLRRS